MFLLHLFQDGKHCLAIYLKCWCEDHLSLSGSVRFIYTQSVSFFLGLVILFPEKNIIQIGLASCPFIKVYSLSVKMLDQSKIWSTGCPAKNEQV